jgi:hypothetical protein
MSKIEIVDGYGLGAGRWAIKDDHGQQIQIENAKQAKIIAYALLAKAEQDA